MKYLLLIIPVVLLLTSCSAKQTKKPDFEDSIQNKYWKLISIDGKTVTMKKDQEREIYFILKNDLTVKGFAGCNGFEGNYQLVNNKIQIYDIAMTMRACEGIEDQTFLNILNNATKYTLEKGTLKLYQSGKISAVFEVVYF